jgi:tetratricopeptide (TPR) repeat protein
MGDLHTHGIFRSGIFLASMRNQGEFGNTGMFDKLAYVWDGLLAVVAVAGTLWVLFAALKSSENRVLLIARWIITLVVGGGGIHHALVMCRSDDQIQGIGAALLVMVIGIILSIIWTPSIAEVVFRPIFGIFDGSNEPQIPKPLYSMAMGKRQRGRYLEAVMLIREQLAKFPNDYEGVCLLAKIQAEDMKDLPSAEMTMNHFCADPKVPPKQFAAAQTQVADWYLQLSQDPHSAQLALEKIIAQYPETELALAAAQRIAHLGGAENILLGKHDRQAIAVPEGVHNVGLLESSAFLQPAEEDPGKLAGAYVKHLQAHPQDTDVREKLAVIYADHYQRLDLAVAELAQMINTPNMPPKRVAHWLTVLANLQIRHGADYDTIRSSLQKIVDAFPNLPVAQSAQSRINHLNLELKGRQKAETPNVKLGVYEQNIGLKYGAPNQFE